LFRILAIRGLPQLDEGFLLSNELVAFPDKLSLEALDVLLVGCDEGVPHVRNHHLDRLNLFREVLYGIGGRRSVRVVCRGRQW
jgi:hypothetical protein